MKAEIPELLRRSKVLPSLTADAWTSCANEGFLGVTIHYISDEWKMVSTVLAIRCLQSRHTTDNLCAELNKLCEDFQLSDVFCAVTDNAENIVGAVRHSVCIREHQPCFGHTLQLCVRDALDAPAVSASVARLRRLCDFFRSSNPAWLVLKQEQQQYIDKQHRNPVIRKVVRPLMDQATRWNSTYGMIDRALRLRDLMARASTVPDVRRRMKHVQLPTATDWHVIKKVSKLLERVAAATRVLEGKFLKNMYVENTIVLFIFSSDYM